MRDAASKLRCGLGAAWCCVLLSLAIPTLAGASASASPVPTGTGTSGTAGSVWCISAGNCVGVGSYTQADGAQQGLLLSEIRGVWQGDQLATLPSGAAANPQVDLNDLYCSAGPSCVAVGNYVDGAGNQQAVVLDEHNGAWSAGTKVTLPNGAIGQGSQLAELNAVWCASASNCVAAGDYTDAQGNQQGLTVTESNGHWGQGSATPAPSNAAGDPQVALTALDCTATSACDVVGIYDDTEGNQEAEILVGAAPNWGNGEANLPGDAALAAQQVQINSLACGASDDCVGAGAFVDNSGNEQPLILLANGDNFSTLQGQMPANADTASNPDAQLTSVWCASAGNCSIVGDYNDSSSNQQGMMLTETNNRFARASELSLPTDADQNSAGANPQVTLNGVWCSAPGNCITAGAYTNTSQAELPLASTESNGVWGPGLALSLPAGAASNGNQSASLASVWCASASCSAVGMFTGAAGNPEPLALASSAEGFARGVQPAAPPTATTLKASLGSLDAAPARTSLAQIAKRGLSLHYTASAPGKLVLRWSRLGTLAGATPTLVVTKPGRVTLKLTLTPSARRALARRRGTWTISATAQFTPAAPYASGTLGASRVFTLS